MLGSGRLSAMSAWRRHGLVAATILGLGTTLVAAPPPAAGAGTGHVSGVVWVDVQPNNLQDAKLDVPLVGATVTLLTGAGVPVAAVQPQRTGSSGRYTFNGLSYGKYQVRITRPVRFRDFRFVREGVGGESGSDVNSDGVTNTFTLSATNPTVQFGADAGVRPPHPGAIGGETWNDYLPDGTDGYYYDPGISIPVREERMPGIRVTLLDTSGNNVGLFGSVRTDGVGAYLFYDLAPGVYRVQFGPRSGYRFTKPDFTIPDASNDSDANAEGKTRGISLTAAAPRTRIIDAGLTNQPPLSG